jgi:DNA-directed RNA polymerase specialized sigma24 family protein
MPTDDLTDEERFPDHVLVRAINQAPVGLARVRMADELRARMQTRADENLVAAVRDLGPTEVARELGVSRQAVSQRLDHARRRLGLEPDGGGS